MFVCLERSSFGNRYEAVSADAGKWQGMTGLQPGSSCREVMQTSLNVRSREAGADWSGHTVASLGGSSR